MFQTGSIPKLYFDFLPFVNILVAEDNKFLFGQYNINIAKFKLILNIFFLLRCFIFYPNTDVIRHVTENNEIKDKNTNSIKKN